MPTPSTAKPMTRDHDAVAEVGRRAGPAAGRASAPSVVWRPTLSRLARVELDEQRVGFGEHDIPVEQPSRDEDLAAVDMVDAGVDLQFLLDRHDLAVVDVQERGALVEAAA